MISALQGLDLGRATACIRESLRLSAELDSTREMAATGGRAAAILSQELRTLEVDSDFSPRAVAL